MLLERSMTYAPSVQLDDPSMTARGEIEKESIAVLHIAFLDTFWKAMNRIEVSGGKLLLAVINTGRKMDEIVQNAAWRARTTDIKWFIARSKS